MRSFFQREDGEIRESLKDGGSAMRTRADLVKIANELAKEVADLQYIIECFEADKIREDVDYDF